MSVEDMYQDELQRSVRSDEVIRIAMTALKQIAEFGHVGGPQCVSSAPVHECGCYEKDESQIAREAIDRIKELEE